MRNLAIAALTGVAVQRAREGQRVVRLRRHGHGQLLKPPAHLAMGRI